MAVLIEFTINGREMSLEIPDIATALEVIRCELGLTGTKEGCGIGECGACTIQVDGQAVNACLMLGAQLHGKTVKTVEGLASEKRLHPLQQALVDNHGVQCGFCTPGMLMSADALLNETPHPDPDQISQALAGNLCRCTGYTQILTSVAAAADLDPAREAD